MFDTKHGILSNGFNISNYSTTPVNRNKRGTAVPYDKFFS